MNIFAPTPRINPSACVNLGRSVFCRNGSNSFDIPQIIEIYIKFLVWYTDIKEGIK